MARKPKLRLFPIVSYGDEFVTGVCGDGRQVIMGLVCPDVTALFFDASGTYLDCEERRWSEEAAQLAGREPPYMPSGNCFEQLIAEQIRQWQAELGFRPETIRVKEFWASGVGAGIEELPGWARGIETADWITSEDERQRYRDELAQWVANGQFVFWWGRSHHMSKEGNVEAT